MRGPQRQIQPLHSTSQDSSVEPSSKPRTSKEEEIQPSKFSFPFEDDPYEILRYTLNYLRERRRTAPSSSPSKSFLKRAMKDERLKEVRCSSEEIQISSHSMTICCSIRGIVVECGRTNLNYTGSSTQVHS
jgi:hypothetical protein